MTILITGIAGFIGFHVANVLRARGETIIGVDNLNDYYDVALKRSRLKQLECGGFTFYEADISDAEAMQNIAAKHSDITHIIHLAAQAGVRYSLENPNSYVQSNLVGQGVMLELARHLDSIQHFMYASSSSVYGANTKQPFAIHDPVNHPVSLYAATKRSGELMCQSYHHLYGIPMTGLRFFTVYGPWGRPDMATFLFTKAILEGKPIKLFNNGNLKRDFTYIDDIVSGVVAASDASHSGHKLYNLGNHQPVALKHFVSVLEEALGKKAEIEYAPMQPGDVMETYADITESQNDLGYQPQCSIEKGLPMFVSWYKKYYAIAD